MTTEQIIQLIEDNGPTSDIISDLISDHRMRADQMLQLYGRYKGDVPILNRTFSDSTKINNKLANDYRGDIIDTITGYIWGVPVAYTIDEPAPEFDAFNARNDIEDLDGETGKMASICGYAARLLYIDRDGHERVMSIPPWECIFIYDGSIGEPQYAIRYYEMEVNGNTRIYAEWYDDTYITEYLQDSSGKFKVEKEETAHMFDRVPLIEFLNNAERQGDFEKVETLIDGYDRVVSDAQNEAEEFRLAYMLFYGVDPDAETIEMARRTGAFGLPAKEEGGGLEFLTKNIASEFIENQKNTLNENIYKFSKTVDMSDEKFSGSGMSGEARKWKLLGLENRAISKERKFSAALRQQFKILAGAWQKKNIQIDPDDIDWEFTRNLPVEMKMEAETTALLRGQVSEITRLSKLSFVPDPQWELEQMQSEQAVNLDDEPSGQDTDA